MYNLHLSYTHSVAVYNVYKKPYKKPLFFNITESHITVEEHKGICYNYKRQQNYFIYIYTFTRTP